MVFRKESKVDAFQRQISALRQQLGSEDEIAAHEDESRSYAREEHHPAPEPESYAPASYQSRDVSGYSFTSQVADYQSDDLEAESSLELAIPTPTVDAQTSVVAHDTTWNGDLQSSGSLHVHGIVDGTLTAADDVYVAEEADVTATIMATNVIVAGVVRGTIRCGSRFEVLPRGRVLADVQAPTLVVHEGAAISGQVRMGPAESNSLPEQPAQPVVHRRAARNRA
jgi:cytoskeletal protein CcmA (bactofilin family)